MTVKKESIQKKRSTIKKKRVTRLKKDEKLQESVLETRDRILTNEEKRELILAHTVLHRKKVKDPLQLVSLYAGVAVTSIVVILGWFYAFSPSILKSISNPFIETDGLAAQAADLKVAADEARKQTNESDLGKMLQQTTDELNRISSQAESSQLLLDKLAESVSSTVYQEGGFNNPVLITSSTTAVKKNIPTTTLE
ncbi:MAG: hypothetical protein ABIB04_01425 [Patescibacteria group bacterium]